MKGVLVLSICTLVLSLAPASFALDPDRDIHQLGHRSWGEKEGYPGRTEALAQTADGFLWMGTDSGLFRFDGVRFERYVPRSGDKLPAGPLRALLALHDGSLWVAYRLENTISVLRNGSVKNYGKADGVTSYPTAIAQDHEGTLWASIETGLIRFNGTRWDQIGADWNFPAAVPRNTSEALLVDSQGTLWAGVNHTILYLERGSSRFTETGVSIGFSAAIAEASDGTIWLSDPLNHVRAIGSSLSRKGAAIPNCEPSVPNGTPGTCLNAPAPVISISQPVRLLFDRRGSLWMTTDTSGVSRIPNPEFLKRRATFKVNDAVQSFTAKDGLSADNCDPILEDREGNIWVATRDGLDQFRDSALVPIVLPTSLYRSSIAPADDGGIWLGGSFVYLAHVHPNTPKISLIPTHAPQLHRDPTGVIWAWGAYSLEQWKNGKFLKIASAPDDVGGAFGSWQVVGDRFGTLWAFSHGRGFMSLEHGRWRVWATPPDVVNQRVANMYAESTGRIWVATYDGSIITMDKGAIVAYSVKTETHLGDVRAFAEHAPQQIWAGGGGGLVLIDHSHFRAIRPTGVDSLGDVTGIVDAGSDGLWLTTADGVIHVSSAEVDRAVRDPSYRFQWERFDSSDGLPGHSEAIYPYPKAIEGTDGKIWFAATKGVAWIDPKKIPRNAVPPPVSITSVSTGGSDFLQLAGLQLPTNANTVQINYSALSLSVPERVRFRFKLDGIDKDWQDVGTRRQAFYNNLGPGPHIFRVIASNNEGVWNETGAILEFSILPAYYQTTWFRLLCGAAFLLLVWVLYQLRLRHVRRQFAARLAERSRVVEDLRKIIDSIPGFVCAMSPQGEVELLNSQLLAYFGKTFAELKQGWATNDSIHPDDRARSFAIFKQSIQTGTPHDVEQRYRRADGVYRWFHSSARPVRDTNGRITGWYALMTDIEDQRRAEQELQRKEAFLAEGQHISSTGTFSWRLDTDEVLLSDEACRIFEFELNASVTWERIGERIHPDDISMFPGTLSQVPRISEGNQEYEIRLCMANGAIKYAHISSHETTHEDGQLEYIGAIQDVTARRLAEESLNELRVELAHMARVTSLGALTASITHEVSQPLSGIMTNAGTCLRMLGADPPNLDGAMETTRRMIRDGNRASEVITRLRALFSKKEAKTEAVDLNESADEVLALCADELQRSRVLVRKDLATDLSPVAGDRVQLQQVILNLLRNASDAMSDISDRPRELVIRTDKDDGDCVRLAVQDTGVGITLQGMERLFDAFYTTKADGMGMGLSVSKSIIEQHGGRLWATANDGPGATLSFSIPAKR